MTSVIADNNILAEKEEGEGRGTSNARKTAPVTQPGLEQRMVERTPAMESPVNVPGRLKRNRPEKYVAKATSVEHCDPENNPFKHSHLMGSPFAIDHKGKVSILLVLGAHKFKQFLFL